MIVIANTIRDAARLALRGRNSKPIFPIPEDSWLVEADEDQLSHVISDLVINADQAMPRGGAITIGCRYVTLGPNEVPALSEGTYVKVSIGNQGSGISGEHLSRIFDPDFNTKQKGCGLGLTTSYAIINKHLGTITVETEVGKGSLFHIYLPATVGAVPKNAVRNEDIPRGKGRILVMDDDEFIRDACGHVLQALGYDVLSATDGVEALDLYRKSREAGTPCDVVIMDLTIAGGMGGREAIQKLLEFDPDAKAIVSSGYPNDPVIAQYEQCGFKGVVAKPYRMKDLGEVLQKVLCSQ